MLLGYGAKVCLRKMRVKAENRMVTDDNKQKQEQRSLTLTGDYFTKIIITTDDIPKHTMPNGIIMMNIFDYLLN